ncbi:hypothetical protein [Microbispora sp. CA-102843]
MQDVLTLVGLGSTGRGGQVRAGGALPANGWRRWRNELPWTPLR